MMKNKYILSGILLLLICLSSNASGKKDKFSTSKEFSLLWEITGNGIQKPSYLYGTIHMYDTTLLKIPREVYLAIDACEDFALEIDLNNIDQASMLSSMLIHNPDSTLDKLLSPETYAQVMEIPSLQKMKEMINNTKPFVLLASILSGDSKSIRATELDLWIHANGKKKNISGIETTEEQMEAINKMSLAEQAFAIEGLAKYAREHQMTLSQAGNNMLNQMNLFYKKQDVISIFALDEKLGMIPVDSNSDEELIYKRNIIMADRISVILQSGKTLFVGVGAGHLPEMEGKKGVVDLLKDKGYQLRSILIQL